MKNYTENIKKMIVDIFVKKGFVDIRVDFECLANKAEGFIGLLLNVKITGFKNAKLHKIDAVVKIAPTDDDFRKVLPVKSLFQREIAYYNKVATAYEAIQDEFHPFVMKQMRCVLPKCISTCNEFRKEMLVIENLNNKGYSALHFEQLDYNHAALILKSIAKLHALSFIYKDRYPEEFSEVSEMFRKNNLYTPNEEFCESHLTKHSEYSFKKLTAVITDKKLRKRCSEAMKDNLITVFKKMWRPSKVNVIVHGDTWKNNFMFIYKNNKPVEVVPLDFQWSTYASIAYDCMYLFGVASAHEIRKNFKELINEYYAAFTDFLSTCGYKAEKFCSYNEFLAEVKKMSLLSICVCAYTLPFVEYPHIPINKLTDIPEVYNKPTDMYRTIVNDLVNTWSDHGFI